MQVTKHVLVIVHSVLLTAVMTGCSATNDMDYSKIDLVSAGGKVTLDGSPLAGAVISFDNMETGSFSFARTDSNGNYTLMFDSLKKGVSVGAKTVQISTVRNILGLPGSEEGEEVGEASTESSDSGGEKKTELVPKCYNSESKLKVEVTASTTTFNFDLKSDCSTTGASN